MSVWLWCGAAPERAKYQPKAEGYLCPDCAAKLVQERNESRELVKMYRELRHIAKNLASQSSGEFEDYSCIEEKTCTVVNATEKQESLPERLPVEG